MATTPEQLGRSPLEDGQPAHATAAAIASALGEEGQLEHVAAAAAAPSTSAAEGGHGDSGEHSDGATEDGTEYQSVEPAEDDDDAAAEGAGVAEGSQHPEEGAPPVDEEVEGLLAIVDSVCDPKLSNCRKRRALEHLSSALGPQELEMEARHSFIQRAMPKGVVDIAVELIELELSDLACAASNFLSDFAFNSDVGARAVLEVFDRIATSFKRVFEDLTWQHLPLLDAAILLCVNIAAICPSGHHRLVPLVRPVCLRIISNPDVSDKLRGNTILLLANLSMTTGRELRELHVADVLLDLIIANRTPEPGRSVAESVIIFLHGSKVCRQVDTLMSMNVVADYCVPLLRRTLEARAFRGMYPHLLYSARLFQVLAQCREYAEALVANPDVVPLLLKVNNTQEQSLRFESDLEGRRLALEALWSLARFRLWPRCRRVDGRRTSGASYAAVDKHGTAFLERDLPALLEDRHAGIRASAVGLWACLHSPYVELLLSVGRQLETSSRLPYTVWQTRILTQLFPFLEHSSSAYLVA